MKRVTAAVFALVVSAASAAGQVPDDGFPKVKSKGPAAVAGPGKAKTPAARVAACKAIGELGEEGGKARRRELCEAMLDPVEAVRVAAMDAMKKVDADMQKLAVGILIDRDSNSVRAAARLGKGAKPLIPLLIGLADSVAPTASDVRSSAAIRDAREALAEYVVALVAIDPADVAVNQAVLSMLANPVPQLRTFALSQVPAIGEKAQALPTVMAFAADSPDMVAAVRMLPALVDAKTKPAAVKLVESLRYHASPAVRDAAAETLKKFE